MSEQKLSSKNHEHDAHVLHFTINHHPYEWHKEYITGAEIRELGKIPAEDEIFLVIKKPWKNELIHDTTRINLARPSVEHFYSREKGFKIELIVDLKPKPWTHKVITFEQVVELAFGPINHHPNKIYTVTYDKGPHQNPEGTMVEGDFVYVKNKMVFNVKQADKS